MGSYRKRPVEIEAFKLGADCIPDWFMDAVTVNEVILHGTSSGFDHIPDTNADIHTLEGWHHANYGDYIIRGVKGEIYPCKSDIFEMTYETVDTPKTNADRIRAMTDEELAEMLYCADSLGWCKNLPGCYRLLDTPDGVPEEKCKACLVKWLQQPAEGE